MVPPRGNAGDQHKQKLAPVEVSVDQDDEQIRAALFSWVNRVRLEQQETGLEGPPLLSAQSSRAPKKKITIQVASPRRIRTSRYLCEGDRKEIIARVGSGEQQSSLPKEFGVSRAAICNLYKNRHPRSSRAGR